MTCVNVTSVNVLDNPSRFVNPFQFEISFECIAHITDDIEWKLTYVGSAESDQHDQELDSVLVGPMQVGGYKIVFQADPPDPTRIPPQDLLGVTVVLLSCFYKDREFIRVGYYVNNEYDTPELNEEPPQQPLYDRLVRNILADKPRVTRYNISWDDAPQVEGMSIAEGGIPATPPGAPLMDPTQAAHAAGLAAQAAGAGAEEAEAAAQAAGSRRSRRSRRTRSPRRRRRRRRRQRRRRRAGGGAGAPADDDGGRRRARAAADDGRGALRRADGELSRAVWRGNVRERVGGGGAPRKVLLYEIPGQKARKGRAALAGETRVWVARLRLCT